MKLTREQTRLVHYAVRDVVVRRRFCGNGVPAGLRELLQRLETHLCSVDGTETVSGAAESPHWEDGVVDPIDTAEAAGILRCSREYVRRIAEHLGGRVCGRTWVFPRHKVIEYASAKGVACGAD